MVFISSDKFDDTYKSIKSDALKGDCTVQIFVAPDTDSLCACTMLTTLLKSDFIKYKMNPVANNTDLESAREVLAESPGDLQSVIMLNAGGTVDVLDFFQTDEGDALSGVKFYIIDSHRPCELANVYDPDRVFLFDDGQTSEMIPEPSEIWNMSDSEGEDEDDEEREAKRARGQDGSLSPRSRRERRSQRDARRLDYYSKTSHGVAASVLMWQLVNDLQKSDNHLLWLAVVGLTDQFIQERISSTAYVLSQTHLADDVRRMNAIEEAGEQTVMDRIQIRQKQELRFMLLRHWTLMDSMTYSRYVATRLGIWKQKGKKDLHHLLAQMGFSLEQCKQQYIAMDVKLKLTLEEQLDTYAEDSNLENFSFPSFESQSGFRAQYSASDLVYISTGLLEAAPDNVEEPVDWKKNFFLAMDVLKMQDRKLLQRGLEASKKQHMALLRQVESIVEGKKGQKNAAFRYVIIRDDPDQGHFIHHPTLRRLGLFLMDTYRFGKDKKRSLPLVMCALNPATETFVVAGMWNQLGRTEGSVIKNEFGKHFEKAAERVGSRISLAAFDSSILEIKSDDLLTFLNALMHTMRMDKAKRDAERAQEQAFEDGDEADDF